MRSRVALSLLLLWSAAGCSKSPGSLVGPVEDFTSIEGLLVAADPSKVTTFRAGAQEAQSVARILLRGKSCEHLKYQVRGSLTLIRKDGRKILVGLMKPDIIEINEETFTVDMTALMSVVGSLPATKD